MSEKQVDKFLVIQYILQGELDKSGEKRKSVYKDEKIEGVGKESVVSEMRKLLARHNNMCELVGWYAR